MTFFRSLSCRTIRIDALYVLIRGTRTYWRVPANTRRARKIVSDIGTIIDPDKDFRRKLDAVGQVDSVGAKVALAEEYEGRSMWREALSLSVEAGREYAAVAQYFPGLEARTRYGLFLLKQGQPQRAQALFQDVIKAASSRNIALTDRDRAWLKVTRSNTS